MGGEVFPFAHALYFNEVAGRFFFNLGTFEGVPFFFFFRLSKRSIT